jgi:peptide/nickel transport system substrate-binding protein
MITTSDTPAASRHPRAGWPGRHPRVRCGAVIGAAVLLVTACTSSGGKPTNSSDSVPVPNKVGNVLTVVQAGSAPLTLDPAKNGQSWAVTLGYEPLIVLRNDGGLAPGLATSWNYTGTGNTSFVVHLRAGAQFADGSPVTAQSVVNDLTYKQKAQGPWATLLSGDTFTASDASTVTITAAKPNPNFPEEFTQQYNLGAIVSPTGLTQPSALGTRTFGAGPYSLDTSQTVTGDHYTYLPNPNYYDKAAVHWKKVVLKIVPNAQSVVNAVKTGQADVALGDPSMISAAKQSGLTVSSTPFLWAGVVLADRSGTLVKALGDARVRQALNYGTDRAAIAHALFPDTGTPTQQPTVPGAYGYDASLDSTYPYDVNKAKQLLSDAGYPNGFSLQLVTTDAIQQNLVSEALAQQWKRIGVSLTVKDYANSNEYGSAAFGGKAAAFTTAFGTLPIWIEGPILFSSSAFFNPLHASDPALQRLIDQQAAAAGDQQAALDKQIEGFLVQRAWFVPVVATVLPIYARTTVTGTQTSAKSPQLDLYEVQPAG